MHHERLQENILANFEIPLIFKIFEINFEEMFY